MLFHHLGLMPEIIRAVEDKGYQKPTPIQQKTIPLLLEGRDMMARAQTGTGKTACFVLPLLQQLTKHPLEQKRHPIRALILTPTRELAVQVGDSIKGYGKYLSLHSMEVYGGVSIVGQIQKLRHRIDILVATPGRLLDHLRQKTLNLNQVEMFVLDEADRMLDMGFIPDVRKIKSYLPEKIQSVMFSATLSVKIKKLAEDLLKNPSHVEVSEDNRPPKEVEQIVHPVDNKRKRELISHLIGSHNWKQVLIFTRTKYSAERLMEQLKDDGIKAAAIHGDKSQGARSRALTDFKKGLVHVLVATDVAARGLDIKNLPHVVNFELPHLPEDYIHRIGRTGRAGNEGKAISLVSIDEHELLREIERLLKKNIQKVLISGYEPDVSIQAIPIGYGQKKRSKPSRPSNQAYPKKPMKDKRKEHTGFGKDQDRKDFAPRKPSSGKRRSHPKGSTTQGNSANFKSK